MSSITLFFIIVCVIAILFLAINFFIAPHNPYDVKLSAFECGVRSFFQTRSPFEISFFTYGIVYLLFDLEIIFIFPFSVSGNANSLYGLIIMLFFCIIVTFGFIYELGKGALIVSSRQLNNSSFFDKKSTSSNDNLAYSTSSLNIDLKSLSAAYPVYK